jgi:hypothetical protein
MRNVPRLTVTAAVLLAGCQQPAELPGPPINTFQNVQGDRGRTIRSRGVMEMYLTRTNPSHTFWNDRSEQKDPWGTITLKDVRPDGTVVIDFGGNERRARVGRVFPGTGIKVIASHPELKTALLRTRWTHTVMEVAEPNRRAPKTMD